MEEQTQAMDTTETQPVPEQPEVTKTATCPSLSGASTLTYEIGTRKQDTFLRLSGNTAAGLFCKEWIPLSQITDLLATGSITSTTLKAVYQGKSSNSAGFLLAVLKAEGIARLLEGKTHHYIAATPDKPKKSKAGGIA